MYCRINLKKTNYTEVDFYQILDASCYPQLQSLYKNYCKYKNFESVLPIFYEEIVSPFSEVIGYFNDGYLAAFSLINLYPTGKSVFAEQFAWDYKKPELRLGIRSLENECARYKKLGYHYLYIGEYAHYKSLFQGFEVVGNFAND